jgi:hypothetical protein
MPPLAKLHRGRMGELAPRPAGETFISHRALGLMSCLAGRDGVTSPEASITDWLHARSTAMQTET